MVQRKAPTKVAPRTEPNRSHGKPERNQRQNTGSKGDDDDDDDDLKTRMIKMTPIKAANSKNKEQSMDHPLQPRKASQIKKPDGSPNYMKPTSSSDARKARDQVTPHPQSKGNFQRKPINLNHSSSGLKPFKLLSRKSSLKILKPSIKNKATCSSTLKDSRFPKALDLNPGGTEAEGTSAMRVCPYSYCSLNGHNHPPLPPLRSFMSARRCLLKTQKSFKLKGQSLFRSKDPVRGEGEMDTGQFGISRTSSGLRITPLIEEVVNDFFVEIYAKPHDQKLGLENPDEISAEKDADPNNPEILDGSSQDCAKGEIYENNREALDQMDEFNTSIVSEDDHGKRSTHSVEEMDDLINFLEYVECDQQIELEPENYPSLVPEDDTKWSLESFLFDNGLVENRDKMIEDHADIVEKDNTDGVGSENSVAWSSDEKEEYACDLSFLGEKDDEQIEEGCESPSNEVNTFASSFPNCSEKSSVGQQGGGSEDSFPDQDVNANCISDVESFEPAVTETKNELNKQCTDEEIRARVITEVEKLIDEGEKKSSLLIVEQSHQQCQDSTETDENKVGDDQIQMESEIEEQKYDEATDNLSTTTEILAASNESYEEGNSEKREDVNEAKESTIKTDEHGGIENGDEIQIEHDDETDDDATCLMYKGESSKGDKPVKTTRANLKHSFADANEKPKLRITITRKQRTEESEENKQFNPRSPTFLPVEPDPESEKVDLKHQMMDERKNSEAWMLDYALQQAVSKLAPARKRKVALLVEAFETVAPLPLRHATSGFDHSRPMQACS